MYVCLYMYRYVLYIYLKPGFLHLKDRKKTATEKYSAMIYLHSYLSAIKFINLILILLSFFKLIETSVFVAMWVL